MTKGKFLKELKKCISDKKTVEESLMTSLSNKVKEECDEKSNKEYQLYIQFLKDIVFNRKMEKIKPRHIDRFIKIDFVLESVKEKMKEKYKTGGIDKRKFTKKEVKEFLINDRTEEDYSPSM